jgi:hypothetical protein
VVDLRSDGHYASLIDALRKYADCPQQQVAHTSGLCPKFGTDISIQRESKRIRGAEQVRYRKSLDIVRPRLIASSVLGATLLTVSNGFLRWADCRA